MVSSAITSLSPGVSLSISNFPLPLETNGRMHKAIMLLRRGDAAGRQWESKNMAQKLKANAPALDDESYVNAARISNEINVQFNAEVMKYLPEQSENVRNN